MIEALLVLLLLVFFGWLLIAVIGAFFSVLGWLICGFFGLLGGLLMLVLMIPIALVVALVVLPVIGLVMLPALLPLLLVAAVVWWLLKPSRRAAA
ncbi:hypothetical protein [Nevskia sp.]|uniref:hypothetical protein n=1 Tax=Nevskia sp. TaxID=1929292 RepID=UPI0025FE70D1|nr:hypothetical protein [Nevskia sp.]